MSDADLAYQAGKNATDDAKGNDILLRYRQLVAQKNADKAMSIAKKQKPMAVAFTPAVSDGSITSSSEDSSNTSSNDDDSTDISNESASAEDMPYRHKLMDELDAEQQSSLSVSVSASGGGGGGGSDKENVTPSLSAAGTAVDTIVKILGSTNMAEAAESSAKRVNRHAAGGKKYFVSKKALALDGQWAMVGETVKDDTEDDGVSVGSICSKVSSADGTSTAVDANNDDDDDDNGGATGVQRDPGELLSTAGVSFLEDASFLDSSVGQVSLDLSWKDGGNNGATPSFNMLSPVLEATGGDESGAAAAADRDHNLNDAGLLSKTVYTFTPGSTVAAGDDGDAASPSANATGGDISAPSAGIFDVEWTNNNTTTSASSSSSSEACGDDSGGTCTGDVVSPLKDASMWVLSPEQDSSDDTLSTAPSDEIDQIEAKNTSTTAHDINGRQVFAELSLSPKSRFDDEDNERVACLSPNMCLRKNAIDQALEETTLYMSKIQDLESALESANLKAANEAQRRRECEMRIDELLLVDRGHEGGDDLPVASTPLASSDNCELLNESAYVSPHSPQDESEEEEQDTSTESSELLDARAATASLMERNQTLVKEIRFADQTCVELSERNAALQRDVIRLGDSLEATQKENESLREKIVESTKYAAKLEEREAAFTQKLSDQKRLHTAQMGTAETELASARLQISTLESTVKESEEEKLALVADVAAAKAKILALGESQPIETTTNAELEDEYKQVEAERDMLRLQCSELEAQVALLSSSRKDCAPKDLVTPQKPEAPESSSLSRTPTSTVLAKTLQSQLERGDSIQDRACEAEKLLVSLQMQLDSSRAETAAAKEEASDLRKQLEAKDCDEGSSLTPAFSFSQDVHRDADAAVASEGSVEKEAHSKEIVSLRSQLHEALYDKKALLLEVSTFKTSVRELEVQLHTRQLLPSQTSDCGSDQIKTKKDASAAFNSIIIGFKQVQAEAERKIRFQQEQIAKLTSNMQFLQTQLDFETASDTDNGDNASVASFSNRLDDSPTHDSGAVALYHTDAVLNATFATDRVTEGESQQLERCEQGWGTSGTEASPFSDNKAKPQDSFEMVEEKQLHDHVTELHSQLGECKLQLQMSQAEVEAARVEAADMLNGLEREKGDLVEENSDLRMEASDLKAALEFERTRLEKEGRKSEQFEQAAKSAEAELCRTSGEVSLTRATILKLQSENVRLQSTTQGSIVELENCRSNLDIANTRIAFLDSEQKRLESELLGLNARVEAKDIEINALSRRCEEQGDAVEQYRSLRLDDAKIVEDLRDALQESTKQTETLKLSYVTCNDKLANAMEQNMNSGSKMQELRRTMTTTEAMLETTSKNLSSSQKQMSALQAEVEALQLSKSRCEYELQQLRDELISVTDQSRAIATDKDATIRELTTLNERSRNSLEKNLSSALQERDQLMKEAEKTIASLQQEVASTTSSMRNVANSLGVRESYIEEKFRTMQGNQTETRHFSFSLRPHAQDRSEPAATVTHSAILRLRATIAAVGEKVVEHDTLMFNAEVEKKRLSKEVALRSRAVEEIKAQLADSLSRERSTEAKLEEANQELDAHLAKLAVAEAALQNARESITVMESKVASTASDCERLKQAHKEKEDELKSQRDSAVTRLNEKENSLVDTLVRQREESSSALKVLKEKLSAVEDERDTLSTKNQSLNKKCSRLRDYVKNLTEKCEEWSESYRIQSTEVISAKKENMDLTQKVSQMHSLVEDCPNPSCTSCSQLRSVIAAQCQVRAALLKPEMRG